MWLGITLREVSQQRTVLCPAGSQVRGTGLTAVVVQEYDSDILEVRMGTTGLLEVLLNHEVLSFSEQSWMDLKGKYWSLPQPHREGASMPLWVVGHLVFLTNTILLSH